MRNEIDKIVQYLNEINNYNDFKENKSQILKLLKSLEKKEEFHSFKYERYLKDKNVVLSLLNKTSDDLRKTNNELLQQTEELDILLNTIPALVFFKNTNSEYVIVNKFFCSFTERPMDEIIGKTVEQVVEGYNFSSEYIDAEKEVINNGNAFYNIEEKVLKHGDEHWLSTNLAPVKSANDEIIGLIGVSWNITDQRNYELQLRKAKQIAEEGTKVKNQFLANISHEIRTPLNGIIGMSQILTKTNLNKSQREYLSILINSSDSLLSLVNDILDFSKVEAGKAELEHQDFNIRELFEDINNVIELKAEEKGLQFIIDISDDFPSIVNSDNYKLKQIILNLAKNAIKFNNKGEVKISASLKAFEKNTYKVEIHVSDTGIGIENDKLEGLFDGFYQVDSTTTRNYGGTGLGLALCKKLVNLMDGEIHVVSKYGKGSDFWIVVNLEAPDERNLFSTADEMPSDIKLKVLLAEDNIVNQKITEFSIKQLGYNITIADNGSQAAELYKKGEYDFILMDLQMPVMNGFDATKEIREFEMSNKIESGIPIIALTANATKEDRKKSFDCGMDGFMSKPFNPKELKKLLIKLSVL